MLAVPKPTLINPRGASAPRGLESGLHFHGSVNAFRAASPLPKDAQELVDKAVVRVGRQGLVLVNDLVAAGLTYSLPNWLAVPSLYWESLSETGRAQQTMIPKARGERQVQDRLGTNLPIYCTWDDFSFGIREMLAAERVQAPLDVSGIEMATRNVNEAIEYAAWNGGPTIGGNLSRGVLNAPGVNSENFIDAEAWTATTHSGADVLADVQEMMDAARDVQRRGPFNLYVPTGYSSKLGQDYKDQGDKTVLQRLQELEAGGRNLVVKVADFLPANTVALIQMTSDVIDVVVGQTPAVVSWQDQPGWERFFVVLACIVPRVRSDYGGASGIVIGTPS